MTRSFIVRIVTALFLLPAFTAFAEVSDVDIRRELLSGARQEILERGRTEVPPEELGDWRETIDTVLFMLFRKTELYRGPVRVMVVDDQTIFSSLYPEGTLVVSTGLLDHVDLQVFELSVNDPRRARDHGGERERLLAPYLAYNAARFALDHDFVSFKRIAVKNGQVQPGVAYARLTENTPEEIGNTDLMACVLLDRAGYSPSLYTQEYLSEKPEAKTPRRAADRRIRLQAQSSLLTLLYTEYATIMQTLRTGSAFEDALRAIDQINESLPGGIYLDRLEALVNHQAWLSAVPHKQQYLATLFPVAAEENTRLASFVALAENRSHSKLPAAGVTVPGAEAGISARYNRSVQAYRRFLSAREDPALASSFALLLFLGRSDIDQAFLEAETAARLEALSSGVTARANHAALLFLSGKDPVEALRILERLSRQTGKTTVPAAASRVLLHDGTPSDDREVLVNLALMFRMTNKHDQADNLVEQLKALSRQQEGGTVSFRGIRLGTTASDLADRWGNPDSITYNFFHEVWEYPKLGIIITFGQTEEGTEPRVLRIRMNTGSPVSPGGDIRTGDSREQFESVFGKPAYRAGDGDVYLSNGMRISVQYLFDRIQSITAGY